MKHTRQDVLRTFGGAAAGALLSPLAALAAKPKRKPCPKPKPIPVNSPHLLEAPFWTHAPYRQKITWPANGVHDLQFYKKLGGVIGLNPDLRSAEHGEVTLWYYADAAAEKVTGVQGLPLSNLIVSNALLSFPNQGNFLKVQFEAFSPNCHFGMRLFGTNVDSSLVLQAPDTMLFTEKNRLVAANGAYPVYTDDYFAGEVFVYFKAPPGFLGTIWAGDLELVSYVVTTFEPGNTTRITPMGKWWVVVSNGTDDAGTFDLTITPNMHQKTVIVPQPPRRS